MLSFSVSSQISVTKVVLTWCKEMGSAFYLNYWGTSTIFFWPLAWAAFSHSRSCICYAMRKLHRFWVIGHWLSQPSVQLKCSLSCHFFLHCLNLCTIQIQTETSCRHHFPGFSLYHLVYVTSWSTVICNIKWKAFVLTSKACVIYYGSPVTSYVLSNCWWHSGKLWPVICNLCSS